MVKKKFKSEVTQLLQLIIHSLYSHKEIFLRELVSNASDALDKLSYLALTDKSLKKLKFDPRIDISFTKNTLSIRDNGIGMNEEDIEADLGVIARSGTKKFLSALSEDQKKDSNLIGKFGVGFYSVFMVADSVEVISKKANEEKAFRWFSEGKENYTIEEASLEGQGTLININLNEEGLEFASRWTLENLIKKYSDHIAYPIYLTFEDQEYTDEKDKDGKPIIKSEVKTEKINEAKALWMRSKKDVSDEEYKEFYKSSTYDTEDPLWYLHSHIEGTQEYTTLFYVPSKAPFDMFRADYKAGVKLYVKRVYITDDNKELLPVYLRFVRGVIDSEDLPLNVSREILQQNKIMSSIRNASVKKLLGEWKKLSEDNPVLYSKFIKEYNTPLKEGLYQDYANRETLLELVRFESSQEEGLVSLASYTERMNSDQKEIYYITGNKKLQLRKNPLVDVYKAKNLEVLIMDDEIDELVISQIPTYKDFKLVAINKSDAIKKDENENEDDNSKKIKEILKGRVKDVIASKRLDDSTACIIVSDSNDPSVQMQNILKQMNQGDMLEVKPILEVNLNHKLIKEIIESKDEEHSKDLANVLLEQALLREGVMPVDVADYTQRLLRLLSK